MTNELELEIKQNLSSVSRNFMKFLEECEPAVPWFHRTNKVMQILETLSTMIDKKIIQAGGKGIKSQRSTTSQTTGSTNKNPDASGDTESCSGEEKDLNIILNPFTKNDLQFMSTLMVALQIFTILEVTLKCFMTQCTPPLFLLRAEALLTELLKDNFQSKKILLEMKLFCLDYGFLDRTSYGGPDSKTEDLIKLLEAAENKLDELEAPFVTPLTKPQDPQNFLLQFDKTSNLTNEGEASSQEQITTLNFLAVLDLKKVSSELILQQITDTTDYRNENFPRQIKEVTLRIINLLSTIIFDPEKSTILLVFIAHYRLLSKKKFQETCFFQVPPECGVESLLNHLLHDGTRGWLHHKIQEWLFTSEKPFFWLMGSEGTGKSCMVSSFCKVYSCYVMGSFVFDNRHKIGMKDLIKSIANSFMRNVPEYLCIMDDIISERDKEMNTLSKGEIVEGEWKVVYDILLRKPLNALSSKLKESTPRRRLFIIDSLNECPENQWPDLIQFLHIFKTELSNWLCLMATCRSECLLLSPEMIVQVEKKMESKLPKPEKSFMEITEIVNLESKNIINHHIKDIEIFFAECFGDVMSKKKFGQSSPRFNPDHMALTEVVDKFLKNSSGKFSYAQHLLIIFEEAMEEYNGQYQCALLKVFERFTALVGEEKLIDQMKNFAKLFNAYRQKDGTAVVLRINVHD